MNCELPNSDFETLKKISSNIKIKSMKNNEISAHIYAETITMNSVLTNLLSVEGVSSIKVEKLCKILYNLNFKDFGEQIEYALDAVPEYSRIIISNNSDSLKRDQNDESLLDDELDRIQSAAILHFQNKLWDWKERCCCCQNTC